MMNLSRLVAIIAFVGLVSPGELIAANGPIVVNIDNPNFRKLVAAVPDFEVKGDDADAKKAAILAVDELNRLLVFSGLFNIMSEAAYSDIVKNQKSKTSKLLKAPTQKGLEGIDVVQWRSLGVESLTIGDIGSDAGGLVFTLRTIDINKSELLIGKRYTKIQLSEVSAVMRRYADLILESYTQKPGIFSSKLAFIGRKSKGSSKQVYISDFDGKNLLQITKAKVPHLSPTWSNDGKFVTFTSYRDGNPDLFIYELATKKTRKLSGYKGINSGSNWSHHDKLVAFSGSVQGDVNIYVTNSGGAPRKLLIKGAGLDVDPAFSPDGKWMAFVSGRYGNPHIFRATLKWDDDKLSVVGDKRLTYAGWYNASPAWSPSGDKIAFAGYDKDIDRFDLFLMNPDGTNLERLTIRVGDNESPSWAPNGQMVAFHSNRMGTKDIKGNAALWIMGRDGSSQRKIDVGLYDAQTPEWSPQLK